MPSSQYQTPATEPIWAALFNLLKTDPTLKQLVITFTRATVDVTALTQAQQPALVQYQVQNVKGSATPPTYIKPAGVPLPLTLVAGIGIYVYESPPLGSVGHEAHYAVSDVNQIIDAVDAALNNSRSTDGKVTLGGLVLDCRWEGPAPYALSPTSQQSAVVIPIYIMLP